MGSRAFGLVACLLFIGMALSAGSAAALLPPTEPFSLGADGGARLDVVAWGLLEVRPQAVAALSLDGVSTLVIASEALAVEGPDGTRESYENVTVTLGAPSATLAPAGGAMAVGMAPATGVLAASGDAPRPVRLDVGSAGFTVRGASLVVTVPPAATVDLRSATGPAASFQNWTAESAAGSTLRFLPQGNVLVTATAPAGSLTPAGAQVNVSLRTPPAGGPPVNLSALGTECARVHAIQSPEATRAEAGIAILPQSGNGTSLAMGGRSEAVDGCTYLKVTRAVVGSGPGALVAMEGEALWLYGAAGLVSSDRILALGPIPLVSLLLWGLAVAALVYRRMYPATAAKVVPHESTAKIAFGIHMVVLAVSLVVWDQATYLRFGSSIGSALFTGGLNATTLNGYLATEILPWGFSLLAFALPVYLAARFVLHAFGCGTPYRGASKAAGLVAAALLGPVYLVFWVNFLIAWGIGGFA